MRFINKQRQKVLASEIRLYMDENIEIAVAQQIKQRGIDVVSVRDLGLLGDTDQHHLQGATEMERVLCTYDSDFLRLAAAGFQHAGIIYARETTTSIGEWIKSLTRIHKTMTAADMTNHVEYLS